MIVDSKVKNYIKLSKTANVKKNRAREGVEGNT
jgi:hypothetical protein